MLIDLHTHTSYGSPCGYMDPDQLVEQAKYVGLDGVCITEHNQLWHREAIEKLIRKHDFLVIGGVEVNTNYGEVLVFGVHEPVIRIYEAEELREMVDRAGGVMIAAHPFRGDRSFLSHRPNGVDIACERPIFGYVDALEVYNGLNGAWEIEFAAKVGERLNLKGTGGSDAHSILGVGSCFTVFQDGVTCEEDLIRAIKAGRFRGSNWRALGLKKPLGPAWGRQE